MIIVTGGLGFIGQNLINGLILNGCVNSEDVYGLDTKAESLADIYTFLTDYADKIECVFHLGAITDTMEMNIGKFNEYNVLSSMFMWNLCAQHNIPLIYASSAATYGDGSQGFDDRKDITNLHPLNPYGWSKQQFDVWATLQTKTPSRWYGLKFFNVYGYDEKDKGNMASVVLHTYHQINQTGKMKLFRSHNPKYRDGEQMRDFIYVEDVVDAMIWFYKNEVASGLYNIGTGKARTFKDLVSAVFKSLDKEPSIEYIDTPLEIRDKYQYFTQAKITKLRQSGYSKEFTSLEDGVKKYVDRLQGKIF